MAVTAADYIQQLQEDYKFARSYQAKFLISEELAGLMTVLDYLERCAQRS